MPDMEFSHIVFIMKTEPTAKREQRIPSSNKPECSFEQRHCEESTV